MKKGRKRKRKRKKKTGKAGPNSHRVNEFFTWLILQNPSVCLTLKSVPCPVHPGPVGIVSISHSHNPSFTIEGAFCRPDSGINSDTETFI